MDEQPAGGSDPVHVVPRARQIKIDEDRLLRVLGEVLPKVRAERQGPGVVGPIGVLVTVVLVLPTATFDFEELQYGLTAGQWRDVVTWGLRAALAWTVISALWTVYRRVWGATITAADVVAAVVDNADVATLGRRRPAARSLRRSSVRARAGDPLSRPEDFSVSAPVRHPVHGPGTVVSVQAHAHPPTVTVRFADTTRTLDIALARLTRG